MRIGTSSAERSLRATERRLREVFIAVAEAEFALPGRRATDSRIALLTGIGLIATLAVPLLADRFGTRRSQLALGLFVPFAIVAAVLAYSVLKFRAKPDDDSDGPPIHGNTGLEIAWTAVPTALVVAIAIVSGIVLAKDDAAGANPLRVDVTAQQFFWSYSYPGYGNKKSSVLRLPVGRSVVLRMSSKDVIHSFWVPEFRQKQDLVPGIHPTLHITPNKVGTYPVVCTELCGLGHALMRSRVVVMEPGAFAQWAAKKGS